MRTFWESHTPPPTDSHKGANREVGPLSFCSALVWCVHPVLNRRHTQWGLVPTCRWCPCVQGPHGQCGGWVRGFRVFPHCGRVGLTAVKVFSPAGPGVHHTSLARSGTAFDERHRAVCALLLTAYHHANSRESTPESRAYNKSSKEDDMTTITVYTLPNCPQCHVCPA